MLRLVNGGIEVGHEAHFESEAQLHDAISAHPEVLPTEDIGLGPLVRLAEELDVGHGPLDLLAVDPAGRLVIVEFKYLSSLPSLFKSAIEQLQLQPTGVSKFRRCLRAAGLISMEGTKDD